MKIFKFEHSEGAEIIAAEFVRNAINHYINFYMDDLQLDDIAKFSELNIKELTGDEITEKRSIYNEETNKRESVSFIELAKKHYKGEPIVLVTPNY